MKFLIVETLDFTEVVTESFEDDEQDDLSPQTCRELKAFVEIYRSELKAKKGGV